MNLTNFENTNKMYTIFTKFKVVLIEKFYNLCILEN